MLSTRENAIAIKLFRLNTIIEVRTSQIKRYKKAKYN